MKYKITVITGTRADYHLLSPLLHRINDDNELDLDLVVTGAHLSSNYGDTYQDIEKDGFLDYTKIPILNKDNNINLSICKIIKGMDMHFDKVKSNLLIVLGDRYEILGAVISASNHHIPIAHIHGGEVTQGAIDESIRHAITKFSHLHFTSCEEYRHRVIQLGEDPSSVFNVGALGVENILTQTLLTKEELSNNMPINIDKYSIVTFHPVTLEKGTAKEQVIEMLEAFLEFRDMNFIITKANADDGGEVINKIIDSYVEKYPYKFYTEFSLGMIRYLSALKYASLVIGNSSSGILEAPSFHVPTINIGDRQKGRLQARSIINCIPVKESIIASMKIGLRNDFRESIINIENPYGNGKTSEQILFYLKKKLDNGISLKKIFFDINFER